jgi:hypothetical protein
MFARVNYPGYESKQTFSLNGSQLIPFDIPLTKITGEKLFFGIYHESGRSVHLNSLYIRKAGDVLAITTDKEVYKPGETVSVTVLGSINGNLTLSGPGGYEEVVPFPGQVTRAFVLPATMIAGTYFINTQLSTPNSELIAISHPFDVAGIQVKVKEAKLDKAKYAASDTINLSLTVESNQDLAAILKTWVVDPEKGYTATGAQGITLAKSEPLLTAQSFPFTTAKLGIHRLVYGVYSGDLLLCSGSEAFDMGEATILGISTDKADYPQGNEPVVVSASLYGTVPATLEFFLDGQFVGSQAVSFSSFVTVPYTLPAATPGRHLLKARLTSGGLTSTKETSFIYGSGLPDLAVRMSSDPGIKDGVMQLTVALTNQGKSDSGPTTLLVYDGPAGTGSLLGTLDVQGLAAGASQTLTYSLEVLGRAGANNLSVVIDPAGAVIEFNEGNNEAQVNFTVPDLTLATTLDKEVYSPGDSVLITGLITNLSRSPSGELTLTTEVKDASGSQVFFKFQNVSSINGMATVRVAVSWPTGGSLPEGTYTVIQALPGKGAVSQKTVTIKMDKDFTVGSDQVNKKVEIGEAVQYNLTLTSLRGFAGEVSLTINNCPTGFTASFTPNVVSLTSETAQATLKMLPTAQVKVGSYAFQVNASGGGRSHDLDLSLTLTDFQMVVTPATQNIRQLDGTTYTIALTALNGFDSPMSLEVEGVPRGMKASLGASQVAVPKEVLLTVSTSKWLVPKTYALTVKAKGRVVSHEVAANLVVEKNPVIAPGVVTAPGSGSWKKPIIRTFRVDGVMRSEFKAFDSRPSLHIAAGDVDGDGIDEVIVGADSESHRSPALVGIFKRDGPPVATMELEPGGHKIRVAVAAGDVDGDWVEEVAVGSYPYHPDEVDDDEEEEHKDSKEEWKESKAHHHQRGQGLVRIYKVGGGKFIDTGLMLSPYEGEGYRGAPNIAFGDVDGDGELELITAPGPDPLAPSRIKVFKVATKEGMGRWKIGEQLLDLVVSFQGKDTHGRGDDRKEHWFKYPDGYGANVAAGDLDGDGKDEILVGAGPDPRKNGRVIMLYSRDGKYAAEYFTAYEGSRYGVWVSCEDVDGDGEAEILTGPGPDPRSKAIVRIFRSDGTVAGEFQAYPDSMKFGVKISKGTVTE